MPPLHVGMFPWDSPPAYTGPGGHCRGTPDRPGAPGCGRGGGCPGTRGEAGAARAPTGPGAKGGGGGQALPAEPGAAPPRPDGGPAPSGAARQGPARFGSVRRGAASPGRAGAQPVAFWGFPPFPPPRPLYNLGNE